MRPDTTDAFRAALQSARARPRIPLGPNNAPTTKVQVMQHGIMHTIDFPVASTPRDIESLQEYAQNTAFGTRNIMQSRGRHINNCLRTYAAKYAMIRGGVFDGLSAQEAEFLEERGWEYDSQWATRGLSESERDFLYEASLPRGRPKFPIVSRRVVHETAGPVRLGGRPSQRPVHNPVVRVVDRGCPVVANASLEEFPAQRPVNNPAMRVVDRVRPVAANLPLEEFPALKQDFWEYFTADPYLEDVDRRLAKF